MAPQSSSSAMEAYRLMLAGRLAEARVFAERAVSGQCACVPAHGLLATILIHLGRATEAEQVISQALQCQEGIADAYDALAHASVLLGQHERSNALCRRAVQLAPNEPRYWYNLALSERSLGHLSGAELACDHVITLDPSHYATYLLRSELRVQLPQANHVEELQYHLAHPDINDRARVLLGYALAKELDDLGRFDAAFRWFAEAAGIHRRHLAYDVGQDERKLQEISALFSKAPSRPVRRPGSWSHFIFIVGLPRSGTTLLERILTGLPGVRSNGETDNFARAVLAASPGRAGDLLARAAVADPERVAAHYARLAGERSEQRSIVEKLPLNYVYLGAIRRALPDSRLILVTRSPLDSCFALYRTLFGTGYAFSYDFEDLARYYAAYERLMAHWRDSFGESLHEVTYESLVGDPLSVGAEVAKHCGLDWSARALEVEKNASASLTASAAQIRRPIYTSSSGRWRRYRDHLGPLVTALRRSNVPVLEYDS